MREVADEDFREVDELDFIEVAEATLRESCDLRLELLAVDGVRLTDAPPVVAPTVVFFVSAVLLLVFAAAAFVDVGDVADADVPGDFTRLNAGALGSYMLVRRPLAATSFGSYMLVRRSFVATACCGTGCSVGASQVTAL